MITFEMKIGSFIRKYERKVRISSVSWDLIWIDWTRKLEEPVFPCSDFIKKFWSNIPRGAYDRQNIENQNFYDGFILMTF